MNLKAKPLKITTGGIPITIITAEDAIHHDLHPGDRVFLETKTSKAVTILDVVDVGQTGLTKKGYIGLFKEAKNLLDCKKGELIHVTPARKPESVEFIKKKVRGKALNEKEYYSIVKDIVNNELSEIELTYFLSTVDMNGMTEKEIAYMTKALVNTGERIIFPKSEIIADKHCIGGVPNNRTTMIVIPIIAATGLRIPKTSSRAITSPAGTADTMETLCNVNLSLTQMKNQINSIGACIAWGGSLNLAPADDKIIRVEKPLSIDAQGLMMSSVLAKKLSAGSTHVLIDIPYGRGAKVDNKKKAELLKKKFERIGKLLGMKIKAILTDGRQTIGRGIGPVLEAKDVLSVLKNEENAPVDLKEKSIMMAGELLNFTKVAKNGEGESLAREILESGLAYEKMMQIVNSQGPKKFKNALFKQEIKAKKSGVVKYIDNKKISKLARIAGAPITHEAGLYLYKKVGDKVKKGDCLYVAYANSKDKLVNLLKYDNKLKPYEFK